MKTKILIVFAFLLSMSAISQELFYEPSGRVYNSKDEKLSPKEVRALLVGKPGMANFYNAGRRRKTVGNVLLIGGITAFATDFFLIANHEKGYPNALTCVSLAAIVVSIPIKIGNGRKVKAMVEEYNRQLKETTLNIDKVNIISNKNGIGMRLTF